MRIKFKLEQEKAFRVLNGSKFWSELGLLHRLSGPAVENPWGAKDWFEDGRLIRSEGW